MLGSKSVCDSREAGYEISQLNSLRVVERERYPRYAIEDVESGDELITISDEEVSDVAWLITALLEYDEGIAPPEWAGGDGHDCREHASELIETYFEDSDETSSIVQRRRCTECGNECERWFAPTAWADVER